MIRSLLSLKFVAILFCIPSAGFSSACPNISGSFQCIDEDDDNHYIVVEQTDFGNNQRLYTLVINGSSALSFVTDNKPHTFELNNYLASTVSKCENEVLIGKVSQGNDEFQLSIYGDESAFVLKYQTDSEETQIRCY